MDQIPIQRRWVNVGISEHLLLTSKYQYSYFVLLGSVVASFSTLVDGYVYSFFGKNSRVVNEKNIQFIQQIIHNHWFRHEQI